MTVPRDARASGSGSRSRAVAMTTVAAAGGVILTGLLALGHRALGDEGFERWPDGTTHGPWVSVFDGEGTNGALQDLIVMRPKPPRGPEETHAGLIVSKEEYGEVDFRLEMRTLAQLRRPRPNPWETAWAIWGYRDPRHFYYLSLKPNGWELGKRDPAYPGGQRFLATGKPGYAVNRWYAVRITHRSGHVRVSVDGRPLVTRSDGERPYARGAVGFYTEDASVQFRPLEITPTTP